MLSTGVLHRAVLVNPRLSLPPQYKVWTRLREGLWCRAPLGVGLSRAEDGTTTAWCALEAASPLLAYLLLQRRRHLRGPSWTDRLEAKPCGGPHLRAVPDKKVTAPPTRPWSAARFTRRVTTATHAHTYVCTHTCKTHPHAARTRANSHPLTHLPTYPYTHPHTQQALSDHRVRRPCRA